MKSDYLDVYEHVYVKVITTDWFDEDTNLSTTYLGQADMARSTKVKAEESFPITARGCTKGQLLDSTECEILIDTGASKSHMSKSYFLECKNLHALSKFTSTTKRIQVGNRQYIGVSFVIPVIITIQKHRFKISTLVSEIHETRSDRLTGLLFKVFKQVHTLFPRKKVEVKQEQKLIVLEVPFVEEISGMSITKLLDTKEKMTLTMKLKFIRNRATFKVTNGTH